MLQVNGRVSSWIRNNALGLTAIFIALTGTAFAAGLAKNSVTSKAIKKGAVKSSDVKDDSLTGNDIKEATLVGLPNPSGPAGPDLTGSYGGLEIAPNAVGTAEIQDGAVNASKLAASAKPVAINATIPEGVGPRTVASMGDIDLTIECADSAGATRLRLGVINNGPLGLWHSFQAGTDEGNSQSTYHNFGPLPVGGPTYIETIFGNPIGAQGESLYETAILENPNRIVDLSIGLFASAASQTCTFNGLVNQAT